MDSRSATHQLPLSVLWRRQGFVLPVLYFLYYCSQVSWTPFFSVYLRQVGLAGLEIGILSGIALAVMLVSQPFWGLVADLRGRRRTLLLALPAASFPLLGYLWPGGFWFLLAWTALHGFLSKGVGPLIDSLVLDHLEEHPGLSFGQLRVWGGVAWAVGALAVGRAVAGRDIRLVFVFGAAFMLLAWLVAWRGTRGRGAPAAVSRGGRGVRALLGNRQLVTLLVLATLLYLGTAPIWSFYPVYMTELGAGPDAVGLAFTLRGLGEMPFYLAAAAIIRRLTSRRAIALTALVFALRLFLYSVLRTPGPAMAVELLHGLTFSLFLVSAIDYVNRQVPREWRATGQTLFSAAYFGAGGILGNAWAGYLYDRIGVQAMFRANGVLVLLVALAALLLLQPVTREGARDGARVRPLGG